MVRMLDSLVDVLFWVIAGPLGCTLGNTRGNTFSQTPIYISIVLTLEENSHVIHLGVSQYAQTLSWECLTHAIWFDWMLVGCQSRDKRPSFSIKDKLKL